MANIQVSKSLYPLLSIIEIALRNNIHKAMAKYHKTENWFDFFNRNDSFKKLTFDIRNAQKSINKRKENINSGKVIAELTFGFWSSLFNSEYERFLWKPLRFAFPNLPKMTRKRSSVSAPINKIRKLRNRVYHYEPIIWNIKTIERSIDECYELLNWLDSELPDFAKIFDDINITINDIEELYNLENEDSGAGKYENY